MYDYVIVGSGLFGAVFAHEANKVGKKCLILEKRSHIGGNIYCDKIEDINVHKYGPDRRGVFANQCKSLIMSTYFNFEFPQNI